jgi:alkyl hydroperoxide reductase subunit D
MTLKVLRESLPDYAKDLKLNLSTLLSETTLKDEQKGGTSFTRQANPTLK